MNSKPKQKKESINLVLNENDVPRIYANKVDISTSIYDVRFDFGLVVDANEKGLTVERNAKIYMSPQHAKEFLHILEKQIKRYEENFGQLPSQAPVVAKSKH